VPTTPCTSSKHKVISSTTNQSVSGQFALKPEDLNISGIIRESSVHATKHNKLQSNALELVSWDESNTLVTKHTLSGLTEPDPFGFMKPKQKVKSAPTNLSSEQQNTETKEIRKGKKDSNINTNNKQQNKIEDRTHSPVWRSRRIWNGTSETQPKRLIYNKPVD